MWVGAQVRNWLEWVEGMNRSRVVMHLDRAIKRQKPRYLELNHRRPELVGRIIDYDGIKLKGSIS